MTLPTFDLFVWSIKKLRTCTLLAFCFFVSLHQPAYAENSIVEGWEFSGFGTLGYAQSDKYDDIILKRNINQRSQKIEDNGWLVDSRLGLQVRKEIHNNWDIVGQIVIQEKVDNSVENSIEMAFLRYQPNDAWSFRLGRMVLDTFQLSDSRDVGYSYHWVRPPTEFYGWIPFSHYDGFKTTYQLGDFDSSLRFEAFVGQTKATVNIGYNDGGTSFNKVKASPVYGGGITWEKDDLTLRAYISQFNMSEEIAAINELKAFTNNPAIQMYWPEAAQIADDYSFDGAKILYSALGFSWTPKAWVVQGEVSRVDPSNFGTYEGPRAYLQIGHRFGKILPHITYSRSWDNRDYPYDPAPPTPTPTLPEGTFEALEAILVDNRLSGVVNQYTISVGLRWDIASQKALKLQCDRTTLYDDSLGIYPTPMPVPRDWQKDTRTWCSTTFDWVF